MVVSGGAMSSLTMGNGVVDNGVEIKTNVGAGTEIKGVGHVFSDGGERHLAQGPQLGSGW